MREPNEAYACIIFSLYAGKSSELTAVMRYLYDSTTFMSENREAAETIRKIGMCEMHHLNMLAQLLLKLGTTPKYHACDKGQFTWWNAGAPYMVYPTYLKMALLENLDSEKKAIDAYNNAIRAIDDNNITTLLRRIVMDEEHHINLLSEIYNRCCK
ncbi:MAG: ferritin-like domain-containing protein [Oscillospiraceae bacterium]